MTSDTRSGVGPPGPGENQLAVRLHLAEHAAHVVLFAVRRAHHEAVASADPRVGFGQQDLGSAGAEPALQRFRLGPGAEAALRRRIDFPRDREAGFVAGRGAGGSVVGGSGSGVGGHRCSLRV